MVHPHFMVTPVMTAAENIILGIETKCGGMLDLPQAKEKIRALASRYRFDVDPDDIAKNLPIGTQQRVEIGKAFDREAQIIILDEPTTVLTPQEIDELFSILRSLNNERMAIIFISHKLREVLEISDNIASIETRDREQFLLSILPMELEQRGAARIVRLMKGAGFYTLKSFEGYVFDEAKLPSGPTAEELAACTFVEQRRNVRFSRTAALINQLTHARI